MTLLSFLETIRAGRRTESEEGGAGLNRVCVCVCMVQFFLLMLTLAVVVALKGRSLVLFAAPLPQASIFGREASKGESPACGSNARLQAQRNG